MFPQPAVFCPREVRILSEHGLRCLLRLIEDAGILRKAGHLQLGQTMLPLTEEVARPEEVISTQ